ncbi:hypothetical protein DFP72DRAFT_1101167, partial [Ephemerocybe angulata]
ARRTRATDPPSDPPVQPRKKKTKNKPTTPKLKQTEPTTNQNAHSLCLKTSPSYSSSPYFFQNNMTLPSKTDPNSHPLLLLTPPPPTHPHSPYLPAPNPPATPSASPADALPDPPAVEIPAPTAPTRPGGAREELLRRDAPIDFVLRQEEAFLAFEYPGSPVCSNGEYVSYMIGSGKEK